ncbi:LD-carboxypeptidase [Cyanobium sp. ATX 6A2]|uniref:S66 peptidase family protein n=1 Tax=Cyanobium sp. ATX 6A2 TaxID=2823700 RepID=UPI0020CFC51E|nr:LD-carboxypeptidase [Cyanobium sp. ATX 6A2]MCP9886576.1 LD-carboxypeptidase [Cyanobium sp. ATX 6A2]
MTPASGPWPAAELVWPPPLRGGDRVAPVAASSALVDPQGLERLEAGIALLESWGLEVQRRAVHERRWGYLAGRDEQRRGDLLGAGRSGADLLACLRGGWGAARLLERPLVLAPRWLLGFSDVTSLLWAQLAQGHGGAIHGPLLTTVAAEPLWSQERLRALLFGEPLPALSGLGWVGGVAEGPLLVGNLTVATHLLGTAHLPDLRGAILVLEEVGEAPYRIDRLLTHWRLSGALGQLAGIGLGRFSDCDDPDADTDPDADREARDAARFTAEQVLRERTADLGIPVLANLPVGHEPGNAALPLGAWARLDAGGGRLELLR